MDERALRAALLKLRLADSVPASQFSQSQRLALDRFARQTGAVLCQRKGRGDIYLITDQALFATHLAAISPGHDLDTSNTPVRAQHIAYARDSKAGMHQHEFHYLVLKAVGDSIFWQEAKTQTILPLSQHTDTFGAAALRIHPDDGWASGHPLWLIENQALLDRTDWLPNASPATLVYYSGQFSNTLIDWLAHRQRGSQILHFPDYDGVGLSNFARLYARLGEACTFWLMPDWQYRVSHYGSNHLWRKTRAHFENAANLLPEYLKPLMRHMQENALALEQEAIWLPAS